ncbi:unnamed protein product [Calicophoron daubneyi]|uniref:Uncharacterized protein n=1 Tax=Calicophoron daubneyi TaxID=300641 RepID=A0AAV2TWD4_CALDB
MKKYHKDSQQNTHVRYSLRRLKRSSEHSNDAHTTNANHRHPGHVVHFRERCCHGIRTVCLPPWLTDTLLCVYRWTGGVLAYALLFLLIYTTLLAVNPSVATLPKCRRIIVPDLDARLGNKTTEQATASTSGLYSIPFGYKVALQCHNGEAFSVLIYYVVGFICGEITELLRFPGLLGMLLGGMALRNVGSVLIPETIYHDLPDGSHPFPLNPSIPLTPETPTNMMDYPFNVNDLPTQLVALLAVNPALSGILRQLALTTILTRAGLGLDATTLKEVCGISPAVVVPNMLRLEVAGWGVAKGIPTMVIAASSLDDVAAITGFGVALAIALSTNTNVVGIILWGPAEALIGIGFGTVVGLVICLLPPPQLEHSHLIRGLYLVGMAVVGVVGSTGLHLPGAGALACITLAFVTASGWRAGFPWRLKQSSEDKPVDAGHQAAEGEGSSGGLEKDNLNENKKLPKISSQPQQHEGANQTDSEHYNLHDNEIGKRKDGIGLHPQRQHPTGAISPAILDALVEAHPSCYIDLEQSGKFYASTPSHGSKYTDEYQINSVVSDAAKITDLPEHVEPPITTHTARSFFRRFSLPQPTADYELDSFSAPSSFRRGLRHGSRKCQNVANLGRELQTTSISGGNENLEFGKDQTAGRSLTITEEEEEEKGEEEERKEEEATEGETADTEHAATPRERGMACVCSMRQTMATLWWIVQPVLFSLIGYEVDFTRLRGTATGNGMLCSLIGWVFRFLATIAAVLPSNLNMRERLFVACAWLPKATVQAAIGPVALDTARQLHKPANVIDWGEQVVTIAALSIVITAPLGAILIALTAPHLLKRDRPIP